MAPYMAYDSKRSGAIRDRYFLPPLFTHKASIGMTSVVYDSLYVANQFGYDPILVQEDAKLLNLEASKR